jgi:hypothetical protein
MTWRSIFARSYEEGTVNFAIGNLAEAAMTMLKRGDQARRC